MHLRNSPLTRPVGSINALPGAPVRRKLPHEVPYWVRDDPVHFITVNCRHRGGNHLNTPHIASLIFESVNFRQERGEWFVHLMLLMPDHLHALISFLGIKSMRKTVSTWKEFTAKQSGLAWQRDFFDHRLRHDESYTEKADYIRNNPVRKGLVSQASEWPYIWEPPIL